MGSPDLLSRRITALDGLRALAITAVFVAHDDEKTFANGGLGVEVFFVLSGFLITSLVVAEYGSVTGFKYRRFLARRFLRLMPALIPVLAFAVFASFVLSGSIDAQTRSAAPFALVYLSNWYRAFGHEAGLLAHTWSLSIEEQFYLVWPLILGLAYGFKGERGVLWTAVTLVAVSTTWRIALTASGASFDRVYNGTDTQADQLLVGCSLALLFRQSPRFVRGFSRLGPVGLVVIVGLMVSQLDDDFFFYVGDTVVAVCAAALISWLVLGGASRLHAAFELAPVVGLGRISYGFYLWHYPIILVVRDRISNVIGCGFAAAILSLGASVASFRFVERPILRWRKRVVSVAVEDQVAAPVLE